MAGLRQNDIYHRKLGYTIYYRLHHTVRESFISLQITGVGVHCTLDSVQVQMQYCSTLYRYRRRFAVHCTGIDVLQYTVQVYTSYCSTLYRYRRRIAVHCTGIDFVHCTGMDLLQPLYRYIRSIAVHCTGIYVVLQYTVQVHMNCRTLYRYIDVLQ